MNFSKGLLLVQLGSPEALTLQKIGEYLYDFLGDPHTLGKPPFFWKPLLRYVIIPLSRKKSLNKYKKMFESNGFEKMPLVEKSRVFLEKLKRELPEIPIELAYQYGCKPNITDALNNFSKQGVKEIQVVPLYPQCSDVTTKAVLDQVQSAVQTSSFKGQVFATEGFCRHKAWAREIALAIKEKYEPGMRLVLSFHGIQQKRVDNGDPYEVDCKESARLIEEFTGITPLIAYQSKYGKGKWLSPSLLETLEKLAQSKENVLVVCPAFTVDNLETIYEIDDEAKEFFKALGGKELKRVACLNDRESWVKTFAHEILPDLVFERLENK